MSAWFFLCRRCSHHRPLSRRPSAAHEPFREGLPRFWADHQLEENKGHGSECGLTFQHYNLGTWTGGCQWLRISDTLSLDSELNKRIGKAATTISKLTKRVWSTELAFWARCCTAASPGFFTHDRRRSLTLSTCAVSDAYLTWPGRTEFQTTQSWSELKFPLCIHYWNRDVCAGSAMLWVTARSQRIFFMENWLTESAPLAGLNYAIKIKMSARGTWRPWGLTSTDGNFGFRTLTLEAGNAVRPLWVWRDTCRTGWDKETNEEGPKSGR